MSGRDPDSRPVRSRRKAHPGQDPPDVTIHINKDVPENLDATKLERVAYMTVGTAGSLSALPEPEAARLPGLVRASADPYEPLCQRRTKGARLAKRGPQVARP